MATRIPLILNQTTARIEELAAADLIPGSTVEGFAGKNALINGNFDFSQRGNSGNVTSAAPYTADRWICSAAGGATCNWGIGAPAVGEIPMARRFLGFNIVAGTTSAWVGQRIENVGTFAGGKATVSFWMRSSVAGKKVGVLIQQVFGSGGSAIVQVEGPVITLGTAFQKYTVTFDVPSIAGKIYGTNDNLLLCFFYADDRPEMFGGQLTSQTGLFELGQVQFEKGEVATDFEIRGYELVLCQRYYEKSYNASGFPGSVTTTAGSSGSSIRTTFLLTAPLTQFLVEKRGVPAVAIYAPQNGGAGQYSEYNAGSSFVANRACAPTNASTRNFEMVINSGAGVAGNTARFHWTADAEL